MSKFLAALLLAGLAACGSTPPPGTPAPTGITSQNGGGNRSVGTLPANTGTVSTTRTQ